MTKFQTALAKRGLPPSTPEPQRRTIPDYNPFPVDALPDVLREFAIEVAESIGCDVSFAALPALTLAGAAIGNALHVSPKRGHTETPLLWACTIGDPGTGKSPGLKPAQKIAVRIQKRHRLEFAQACAAYKQAFSDWVKAGEDPEKKPPKPVPKQFHVSDITVEQTIVDAGANPRGMMLVRDELAGWFGSLTRYRSSGTDAPTYLSIYDAGSISYRRRTGEPSTVEAEISYISICGGIQPDALRRLFADGQNVGNGLASRFIFAYPPKCCPDSESELSFETEQNFKDVIGRLQELPFTDEPHIVKLMPDAYTLHRKFSKEFSRIAEGIEGGPEAAVYPKAKMLSLRLALIDHAVTEAISQRDPGKSSVPLASMTRAITLARWFTAEAIRVYAMLAEAPEETAHRHIVELVKRKGGSITARELQRSNNRKYPDASTAELALEVLVSAGYGQWKEERPERGGKTTNRFVLKKHQPMPEDCDEGDEGDESPDAVLLDQASTAETAKSVDPWNDVAEMDTAMKAAGMKWKDALTWLELPTSTTFFQVPEDQRRRAYLQMSSFVRFS